jgi:hypothetical protein
MTRYRDRFKRRFLPDGAAFALPAHYDDLEDGVAGKSDQLRRILGMIDDLRPREPAPC